jgi:hypothetical protein
MAGCTVGSIRPTTQQWSTEFTTTSFALISTMKDPPNYAFHRTRWCGPSIGAIVGGRGPVDLVSLGRLQSVSMEISQGLP